jgi:predicted nucleotidyltransferase
MERIRDIVLDFFRNDAVSILLFGSRARGEHAPHADVDIGLIPPSGFNRRKIAELLDIIENSTIPYKVEIVNLDEVTETFRNEAMRDAVVWKG